VNMRHGRSVNWIKAIGFVSASFALAGQNSPDPLSEPGLQHFYNLEYDQALEAFSAKAAANPNSMGAQNHIAQTVLYQAMFHHGALESDLISATNPLVSRPKLPVTQAQQARFDAAIGRAIELANSRLHSNPKDTEALYSLGVAVGLRANWNYLVHKAWIDPLRDATQARRLHLQATEVDPNFADARLVQGVHDYLIGSLPITIKMLGFLAGFRGDRDAGIKTLRDVVEKGSTNRADAAVLLSAILRREKRQAEAIPLLTDITNKFPRNYLFRYELALLHAELGEKVAAFNQIGMIEQTRTKDTPGFRYLPTERVQYMRGNLHFVLREYDTALTYLKQATSGGHLDANASAQAWLRMGQVYDSQGKRREALAAYRNAVQAGPQTASGKEAKDYISYPYRHRHA
jgi:tetratricopeptide (TPR) repeat protein